MSTSSIQSIQSTQHPLDMPLLNVINLKTYFHTREGVVRAVDGISYSIEAGQTLGIVGESGAGKSVSCYSLLGLIPMPPGRIESGSALFGQTDLLACSPADRRAILGRDITMIFQDPMTALNPYMRIGAQVMEPLRIHALCSATEARVRAVEALRSVGIQDPERRMQAWPHEFSGGMRQRVMIAMALITGPRLLIADEPATALDVTVQAQILRLIKQLQEASSRDSGANKMAVILITHNLAVVAGNCDRVLVMYAGRIVEAAATRDLFYSPAHPYTRALLKAIPAARDTGETLYTIPGEPPDLSAGFRGCPFAPRCEHAVEKCSATRPGLAETTPAHATACLRIQEGEI